jgi:Cell division GTPase
LLAALRSPSGRCLFGFGESDSDNRAHDALAQALKNPLMDRGRMLAEASHVLVQVSGGPGMTLTEVEILMQDLGKHIRDDTQIIFGTAVDSRMGNRLSVTLISSLAGDEVAPGTIKPAKAIKPAPSPPAPEPVILPDPPVFEQEEEALPAIEPEPLVVEPPAFTPELIEADLATPTAIEPVESEPVSEFTEEPSLEPPAQTPGHAPAKEANNF